MALYEVVFVARADLNKQDVEKLSREFAAVAEKGKGKVLKQEYWGLRNLAYKIKKNGKGHYALLGLDASAAAIAEIQRLLGINENVVRHLVVKVGAIDEKPSAILRSGRDEDNFDEVA